MGDLSYRLREQAAIMEGGEWHDLFCEAAATLEVYRDCLEEIANATPGDLTFSGAQAIAADVLLDWVGGDESRAR